MQHTAARTAQVPTLGPDWIEALVSSIATTVEARIKQQMLARREAPAAPAPSSPFMSVNEAAVFLCCKPQRVYDLLSARTLGRYRDGARVLIKRSELEMYVTATQHARTGALRVVGRS